MKTIEERLEALEQWRRELTKAGEPPPAEPEKCATCGHGEDRHSRIQRITSRGATGMTDGRVCLVSETGCTCMDFVALPPAESGEGKRDPGQDHNMREFYRGLLAGGLAPASGSFFGAAAETSEVTTLRAQLADVTRERAVFVEQLREIRKDRDAAQAEVERLDSMLTTEIETRELRDKMVEEIATSLGCREEWTNLHDHYICVSEAVDQRIEVSERLESKCVAAQAEASRLREALEKINAIRNSIVGCQAVNFSEHVYPLVAALEEAGFKGKSYDENRANVGTLIERATKAEAEAKRLREALRNARSALSAYGRDTDEAHVVLMQQVDAALAPEVKS